MKPCCHLATRFPLPDRCLRQPGVLALLSLSHSLSLFLRLAHPPVLTSVCPPPPPSTTMGTSTSAGSRIVIMRLEGFKCCNTGRLSLQWMKKKHVGTIFFNNTSPFRQKKYCEDKRSQSLKTGTVWPAYGTVRTNNCGDGWHYIFHANATKHIRAGALGWLHWQI